MHGRYMRDARCLLACAPRNALVYVQGIVRESRPALVLSSFSVSLAHSLETGEQGEPSLPLPRLDAAWLYSSRDARRLARLRGSSLRQCHSNGKPLFTDFTLRSAPRRATRCCRRHYSLSSALIALWRRAHGLTVLQFCTCRAFGLPRLRLRPMPRCLPPSRAHETLSVSRESLVKLSSLRHFPSLLLIRDSVPCWRAALRAARLFALFLSRGSFASLPSQRRAFLTTLPSAASISPADCR